MRIAAIQHDIVWESKPDNHATVERMLDEADIGRDDPRTFVLLPEMGDTGFSFNLDCIVDDQTLPWATELARRRSIWMQVGYAVRADDDTGRNCASIINPDGAVVATYQKVHPFSYGREADYFTGGDHLCIADCDGAIVSPLICYDLRFPELFRLAALAGAEVLTIGANWPSERQHHWRSLLIARAIENQAYLVAVNRVGSDPRLSYLGGSMIVSPTGEVLAEAKDVPTVLQAEIDLDSLRDWRRRFPALKDVHSELIGSIDVHDARRSTSRA